MRLYTFVNYYLSSIQQGIQSAHLVHELFNKYRMGEVQTHEGFLQLHDWSRNHKTMVVLNGGNCETLTDLAMFIRSHDNPYPWNFFNEDAQSLANALTCVGIVLPERIYEASASLRTRVGKYGCQWHLDGELFVLRVPESGPNQSIFWNEVGPFTPWEREMIERLGQFSLAK